ncbi:MAG: hypothetical protein IIW05_05745 [Paludibacteraceae bacterium]|nr:hypothetical protein [Paludibacteraceae bacterium]MBQ2291833.1 hypothetical protein [Paludibacteraceae bacterium]MBQ5775356.1 hypothetical protein [Paludibacteraceae bacterium]
MKKILLMATIVFALVACCCKDNCQECTAETCQQDECVEKCCQKADSCCSHAECPKTECPNAEVCCKKTECPNQTAQ